MLYVVFPPSPSNIVNYVLDKPIYYGLLGDIAVGIAWTQANFLVATSEIVIISLDYLGLIMLVYEGN